MKFGPRTIDIDILFYGNICVRTNTLELPHPLLHERDFVLGPLNEYVVTFFIIQFFFCLSLKKNYYFFCVWYLLRRS